MKIVYLEPVGVDKAKLLDMTRQAVGEAPELVYYDTGTTDEAELIERSKDADMVVLTNFPYREAVISRCPKLKMICVAFTGTDHVDVEYCRGRGITVCNCAGYSTAAVAELVLGMAVALTRNLLPCDRACRAGGTKDGLVGFELEGKSFGIIGTGAIGQRVAAIANALGCRVYAWSRTQREIPGVTYLGLDELLERCDIVSIHVAQTPDTVHLINRERLSRMKRGAYLINTSRGPVVNSADLAEALRSGALAGAGIDVFETEPPIAQDHPLLLAPNVIAAPHVGFASWQAFEKRAVIVVGNIRGFLSGHPQNLV